MHHISYKSHTYMMHICIIYHIKVNACLDIKCGLEYDHRLCTKYIFKLLDIECGPPKHINIIYVHLIIPDIERGRSKHGRQGGCSCLPQHQCHDIQQSDYHSCHHHHHHHHDDYHHFPHHQHDNVPVDFGPRGSSVRSGEVYGSKVRMVITEVGF